MSWNRCGQMWPDWDITEVHNTILFVQVFIFVTNTEPTLQTFTSWCEPHLILRPITQQANICIVNREEKYYGVV